jgi:xanthine dehydrogenase molybdopterin-binding subunit B
LGRKTFAAISAVEGLKLSAAGKRRLKKTEKLTPAKRRAEVIVAYKALKAR